MSLQEYVDIKADCVGLIRERNILPNLLKFYKTIINSIRRSEEINTAAGFLKILEKRNALTCNNVRILERIVKYCGNTDLLRKIILYQTKVTNSPWPQLTYANERKNCLQTQDTNSDHDIITEMVTEMIASEIGRNWRDFARYLNISESHIDVLDDGDNKSSKTKTLKVLEMYSRKCNPHDWANDVCNALEKSRRQDLRRKVQKFII